MFRLERTSCPEVSLACCPLWISVILCIGILSFVLFFLRFLFNHYLGLNLRRSPRIALPLPDIYRHRLCPQPVLRTR